MRRSAWVVGVAAVAISACGSDGTGDWTSGPAYREDGSGSSTGSGTAPGTLTAGAWDDNRNYEWFTTFRDAEVAASTPGVLPLSAAEHDDAFARFGGERSSRDTLDLAFVIDTTGSMGDEITYLQTEIADIASRLNASYPGAQTRWALILYRDEGDEYVVRTFDFDADVGTFRSNLAAQSAGGGGDYPEASHAALSAMSGLAWRSDAATARVAFWVADAPHHEDRSAELAGAVRAAAASDVHVYPVASSGVDRLTELSMRAAAQLTGGRYLFLTDDSGVGGSHLEPSIPCYFVTLLSDAMIRMVDIEMTGEYREPTADRIIRTGGDPLDGACTLEGGEVVRIF